MVKDEGAGTWGEGQANHCSLLLPTYLSLPSIKNSSGSFGTWGVPTLSFSELRPSSSFQGLILG